MPMARSQVLREFENLSGVKALPAWGHTRTTSWRMMERLIKHRLSVPTPRGGDSEGPRGRHSSLVIWRDYGGHLIWEAHSSCQCPHSGLMQHTVYYSATYSGNKLVFVNYSDTFQFSFPVTNEIILRRTFRINIGEQNFPIASTDKREVITCQALSWRFNDK